jgi:DNA polymerase III delta prime subunit
VTTISLKCDAKEVVVMENKIVSLDDIVKLVKNIELSEKYVRYIAGFEKEKEYQHQEIEDINNLLQNLKVEVKDMQGFIYSYVVPQLNKEFDLLKITNMTCINIELKSKNVGVERIKKQLLQNKMYLKLLGKELYLYSYISETNKLYCLENDELMECHFISLKNKLSNLESIEIDLDKVFSPKNVLVSPLNTPNVFLKDQYLLTENQKNIKDKIIKYVDATRDERFYAITGDAGTGKTLLLYDLVKYFAVNKKVLVVHSGILCEGHFVLESKIENVKIVSAKELKYKIIKDIDLIFVDEGHRLRQNELEKICRWTIRTKSICIFSYDNNQKMSLKETIGNTVEVIENSCKNNISRLTTKIRTNKEMAKFINCLFNLGAYKEEYKFSNIKIIYEPNKSNCMNVVKKLEKKGYTYISLTPSIYPSRIDYQNSSLNTHKVIGQEFDNVCMIMDENFYYEKKQLKGKVHPNPDYLFVKLLYQGVTRARSKLTLIVSDESLLSNIMILFSNQ